MLGRGLTVQSGTDGWDREAPKHRRRSRWGIRQAMIAHIRRMLRVLEPRTRTTSVVHGLLKGAGLDVHRSREPLRFLRAYPIRTVLDIGANEGQFAATVRRLLPDVEIHSFEPLSEPFSKLERRQSGDRRFFASPLA